METTKPPSPKLLIDSNILVYSAKPGYLFLRDWVFARSPAVSAISRVEVLGYHKITTSEQQELTSLFSGTPIMPLSSNIVERAIQLRQQKKMSLGDALVAATALELHHALVTRNKGDFIWIPNLQVFDPFDPADFQQIV